MKGGGRKEEGRGGGRGRRKGEKEGGGGGRGRGKERRGREREKEMREDSSHFAMSATSQTFKLVIENHLFSLPTFPSLFFMSSLAQ